ncbi:MAG TPA: efflux RND transporter periplasmic adaptor subunit [Herbaspirillum sp.]|nr:efflux RND transporter periplasmic adaptor subunit [Herbaspirillum sp.]
MKSSTPSHKAIMIAVGILMLGAVTAFTLSSRAAKPPAASAPAPASVSVASVLQKSVTEWDDFSGRVDAVDRVEIRPRVAGAIDAVHFQEGQLVKKGDLLFTIDPRPYQAELARADAAVAGAQATLALSTTELERTRRLLEEHAVAQRELDQRENTLVEANASLQAAKAAQLTARLNLQYTAITAPVSGRVSRAEITVGNVIAAGATAPVLATLVSVSPVYVDFEVDESTYLRYASNGAVGNSGIAHIPVAIGLTNEDGYPRQGKIKSFDNRLNTGSGTIRVRAVFDNANGALTPGMYARVRTGGAAAEEAVLIDDKAVGTDQDKKYVMVVGSDNKATYRAIKLGPMVDGLRIVRAGLKKDEKIVVNGLQRIRPNDTVKPVAVPMGPQTAPATPV